MEKRIFSTITEVTSYLTTKGFVVSGGKILWSKAENDTQCYLNLSNNIINLHRSDGEMAFEHNLVDFSDTERPLCAIVYQPLLDDGVALYLGMVAAGTSMGDITFCCANLNATQYNGLIVISPAEDDGHWYYGWASPSDSETEVLYWCMDNGHGNYEYGENVQQIAPKKIYQTDTSFSLARAYLNNGYWSKNFRVQLTGSLLPPSSIFLMNGQKYINFTNNTTMRAPVYKLPPESVSPNLSTSTESYSPLKTYIIGDYCIYDGLLYKCKTAIPSPEPFDENKWIVTTVHNELMDQERHIYG